MTDEDGFEIDTVPENHSAHVSDWFWFWFNEAITNPERKIPLEQLKTRTVPHLSRIGGKLWAIELKG